MRRASLPHAFLMSASLNALAQKFEADGPALSGGGVHGLIGHSPALNDFPDELGSRR